MHPLKRSLLARIDDMPPEFIKAVDDNFWKLIDNPPDGTGRGVELKRLAILPHDGYAFMVNLKNIENEEYEIIGFYIDRAGYLQQIKRNSVYGDIVATLLAV